MVYRWYKLLSPRIELEVECGEFNQETGVLFVEIFQVGCFPNPNPILKKERKTREGDG